MNTEEQPATPDLDELRPRALEAMEAYFYRMCVENQYTPIALVVLDPAGKSWLLSARLRALPSQLLAAILRGLAESVEGEEG